MRALLVALVLYSLPLAACTPGKRSLCAVSFLRAYDGDTIYVELAHSETAADALAHSIPVRLLGIDAPELHGAKTACERELAQVARDYVVKKLSGAKQVDLESVGRDKYFRLLADVLADGESVAAALLAKRLAVPYDGGKKKLTDWCAMGGIDGARKKPQRLRRALQQNAGDKAHVESRHVDHVRQGVRRMSPSREEER